MDEDLAVGSLQERAPFGQSDRVVLPVSPTSGSASRARLTTRTPWVSRDDVRCPWAGSLVRPGARSRGSEPRLAVHAVLVAAVIGSTSEGVNKLRAGLVRSPDLAALVREAVRSR